MTPYNRRLAWLRSIRGRLFISHILVGALTPLLIALLLVLLTLAAGFGLGPADYATYAEDVAIQWLMPNSNASTQIAENATTIYSPPGYVVIANAEDVVIFVNGASPCATGERLEGCASHFVDLPPGETLHTTEDAGWVDVVLPLETGDRVLGRFVSLTFGDILAWLLSVLPDLLANLLIVSIIVAAVSIPISAILVRVFARPLLRRIGRIATTSQQFADGDLTARVLDPHQDEVGGLARQFDAMADVLQGNIFILRDLLKSNAKLWEQVEQAAVQGERLRLARDLHDELAQQLFSLTMNSAALPDMITQDIAAGHNQARYVAELAEKTLVGLRALLVDLRPGGLLDMGLAQGLKVLCSDWEQHHPPLQMELSILLTHEQFPASLRTAVLQIVRESLSNIAKHAQATQVTVALVEGRQQIVLSISDNGQGMSNHDQRKEKHYGLITMRERAEALGGTLYVESESGRGTTIRAVLPSAGNEGFS